MVFEAGSVQKQKIFGYLLSNYTNVIIKPVRGEQNDLEVSPRLQGFSKKKDIKLGTAPPPARAANFCTFSF